MYRLDEKAHALYLGRKLRQLRKQQNLTQLELAQQVGITNGQISTIERGVSSPSLATLHRISRALNVPMPEFFEDDRQREIEVSRRGEGRKVANPEGTLDVEVLLSRSKAGAFNVIHVELDRGELRLNQGPNLPDEFFAHVLHGKCEISVGDDQVVLDHGDSVFVKAQRNQVVRNAGPDPLRLLLVTRSENIAPEIRSLLEAGKA